MVGIPLTLVDESGGTSWLDQNRKRIAGCESSTRPLPVTNAKLSNPYEFTVGESIGTSVRDTIVLGHTQLPVSIMASRLSVSLDTSNRFCSTKPTPVWHFDGVPFLSLLIVNFSVIKERAIF
jgi:hypothetical protein